jgi:hypothetical protein
MGSLVKPFLHSCVSIRKIESKSEPYFVARRAFLTSPTSHPVAAHGSCTNIPHPSGKAQEGGSSLPVGVLSHSGV